MWENFGPGHIDRCEAVAQRTGLDAHVVGIEIYNKSETYNWEREDRGTFERITLFKNNDAANGSAISRYFRCLSSCIRQSDAVYFLCHYERCATFALAMTLRLLGRRVFVMNDSKFDDYSRSLSREIIKYIYYLPYQGALASGTRSKDYMRFLGVPEEKIRGNYNALSLSRIQALAMKYNNIPTVDFHQRHFTVVARLVPKKNLFRILDAYKKYSILDPAPRIMRILGSGPLEKELHLYAEKLGVSKLINWLGFVQTDLVAKELRSTLALILLSTEEQFGNVVIEAQALSVPCIVSPEVGARDHLIRSAITGFIVESDNPDGAAYFMHLLAVDEPLWQRLRANISCVAQHGDSASFAAAVTDLIAS